ncbi:MAG TPA: serine/threonine-protein kinase [Haliangium sp.]|nr:serine/threonine-protein kinase [Haliangium sp.]
MSRYELQGVLGRGGMAVVHEARRVLVEGISMPVAVKCLRPEIRRDRDVWQRFAQEALIGFTVNNSHRNLVTVYELIEDEDRNLWIVMDLVRGCTLRDLIRTGVPIPTEIVRRIVWEVLAALEHVHAHSVLHRDISPDNVLLSMDGDVRLSDLGLAKLVQNGRGKSHGFRGKTAYAPAEQLRSQTLDCRSDLYALGAVLYETLTGAPPFGDELDSSKVLARMQHGPPPLRDNVPPDLRDLVQGVLHMAMDQRKPESASQAMRFIQRFQLPLAKREELGDLVTSVMRSHLQKDATHAQPAQEHLSAGSSQRRTLQRMPKQGDQKHFTLSVHREPRTVGREIWVWRGVAIMAALALLVSLPRIFGAGPSPDNEAPVRAVAETMLGGPPAEDMSAMSETTPSAIVPVEQPVTSGEHPAPTPAEPPARPRRTARSKQPSTDPPWTEVPRVKRTPWHIYLAEEKLAEEKKQ